MGETKGNDIVNNASQQNFDALIGIRTWLKSIGLSQHFELFTLNGFDSMDFVKEIKLASELNYIGITSKNEQRTIMESIKKLNDQNAAQHAVELVTKGMSISKIDLEVNANDDDNDSMYRN